MKRSDLLKMDPIGGSMFAVIPSVVMRDSDLPMSAKMLYGIITWRCNEMAYCWASNKALGDDLGISGKRVSALVSTLEACGHIEVEIVRDRETNQVVQRRIYPIVRSSRPGAYPMPENEDTPHSGEEPSPQDQGDPIPENGEEKYKYKLKEEHPPIVPPKGDGCAKSVKKEPDWKPERFHRFWESYPRGEDKQAAIREWDKLKPDDSLLKEMALGLARDLSSDDWQRGIGIPYACRWLKNRRWEDEHKKPAGSADSKTDSPAEYRL